MATRKHSSRHISAQASLFDQQISIFKFEPGELGPEAWRRVDKEGFYEVSNYGRVRSWKATGISAVRNRKARRKKPYILSPGRQKYGHCMVSLACDPRGTGKPRWSVLVHQLVAWAFIGPQPEGTVIRHLDGDATNNRVDNLVYGTPWDNYCDRFSAPLRGFGYVGICLGHRDLRLLEHLLKDESIDERTRRFLEMLARKVEASIKASHDPPSFSSVA